ncbi:MAG TPA: hypothetical protein VK890_12990 [Bacteroidia bacterium]|nr:hypothetical protein [Bacteroidia bacterium]
MRVLISFLFLFNCSFLYAQQDTGKVTFRVKRDTVKNIELHFVQRSEGGERGIIINEQNGSAIFFWSNSNNRASSSFAADTASIDTLKNIITYQFLNDVRACLVNYKNVISHSNYVVLIHTLDNGKMYGATIDQNFINNAGCNADKLNKLVRLLNTFDKRYRFPK